jgi:large subunit ribosomal protein L19
MAGLFNYMEKTEKQGLLATFKPGMTVRVYQKIKETNLKGEEKERQQYFEGLIIALKHGKEAGATMTVRKISGGVEVEKIFPLNLPTITKIEIKKQAETRRAKLYFIKRGYKKKLKEKRS